jgi:hypothetical protein
MEKIKRRWLVRRNPCCLAKWASPRKRRTWRTMGIGYRNSFALIIANGLQ